MHSAMFNSNGYINVPEEEQEECQEEGHRKVSKASEANILEPPITINVSGLRYEVRKSTLERFPDTLLGSNEKEFYYDINRREYFFERHRQSFDTILYYYQSGGLINIPSWLNPEILAEELKFFKIGNNAMISRITGRHILATLNCVPEDVLAKDTKKRQIYMMFADPDSSTAARYIHYVDTVMIMVAIAAQCIETLPTFDHLKYVDQGILRGDLDQDWDVWLCFMVEVVCIVWFSMDFIVRLILCPNKKEFASSVMNWIDFLSIIPFYLNIALNQSNPQGSIDALMILRVTRLLRVLRLARIFKMSRRFDGLFALGYALKTGASELTLLVVLLTTCVVLFSSLVFFANESDPDSPFDSIIHAFWWCVVTMSTVGYGDQVPTTFLAKVVGVFTALTGILVIALPYPIIVSRFNKYYELQKKIKGTTTGMSVFDDNGEGEDFVQPQYDGVIFRGNREEFSSKQDDEDRDSIQYFCHVINSPG